MNKFTSLEAFKSRNHSLSVYTMSWIYAGITAWFSQQEKFQELEFLPNVSTLFVEDWVADANLIDQYPEHNKYFGLINEGHPEYWFEISQWKNTTLITGHDHANYLGNGNRSIGFDRWDFHQYKINSDPRISMEVNRRSIQVANYDILILKGRDRPHRNQWLSQLATDTKNLKILIGPDKDQLTNAYRICDLGYEEYLNKFAIDKFSANNCDGYGSFFDENDWMAIQLLPHRRMYQDCLVNAVLETTCYSTDFPFLTEKTWKPIIHARPFVIFGDTGSLRKLQEEGFLTFAEFCDESYDTETDLGLRINKSITALHQLIDGCRTNPDKIDAICNHNQKHFFNIGRLENKLAKFGRLCIENLYS
jgi:hypothetical protein